MEWFIVSYLPAFVLVCLVLVPFVSIKWYLATKAYKRVMKGWTRTVNVNDQLMEDLQKKDYLIGRLQSKRDKHKQELASWKKQKYNLQQRIKELEGVLRCK